ncbi:hypothetical protein HYDPIDRAFT_113756 [Hydnomerulius pinastri MD-312]|uniref:Uncharacterized protein n=1 Tax=Hydnomerulius pinastri MD-312 TaxID=994086 RepID=A0A0C9VC15_9AGAM|nr:hypothetical protein HYDPIDRAFT_113756 [Hydnomerulius pinastri MD-312]
MTTTTTRGADNQQYNNLSHTSSVSPTDESEVSSHPTSTSTHTSGSSPPTTPPRGRPQARYPESLGRVPLHRRGTSKTYERLEDLLREAGYKETRVFTPETERITGSAAEKQENRASASVRGGVGAVVGFFTGLVSRGSSLSRDPESSGDGIHQDALGVPQAWSPPPSPLAAQRARNKALDPSSALSLARYSHGASSESLHTATHRTRVELTVGTSPKRSHARPGHHVVQVHQSSRGLPHHHPHSHLRPHHHHYSSKSHAKPDAPSARAYLRHMASAPNIQPLTKRPSSSEVSLRSHQAHAHDRRSGTLRSRRTLILNDDDSIAEYDYGHPRSRVLLQDDHGEAHPPLPRNWIESVAKAILSGSGSGSGSGAGVVASDTASTKTTSTRKTSSALSDNTNRREQTRGRSTREGARPPLLCAQVQERKAKTSEGQVSCTRVVCRSAPTSRAGSRVRGNAVEEQGHRLRHEERRREREAITARDRRTRGKDKDADIVPSLARTRAENDEWIPRNRYLGGWGLGPTGPDRDRVSSDEDNDDYDDEDEEGELGLDRLLVPARRQHSIQSLRRHLQRPRSVAMNSHGMPPAGSPRSGRLSPFGALPPNRRQDWQDASWGTSGGRQWLAAEGDEDGEGEVQSYIFSGSEAGTGRSSIKRRRAIPGSWAQWNTAS